MAKMLRYFCVVGPEGHPWAHIAHAYLQALLELDVGVRVLPIGGASLGKDRWQGELFTGELAPNYVNVVCAPPGVTTGRRVTATALAPSRVVGTGGGAVPAPITAAGRNASADVVYEPELALAGLLTAGKRNIAITGPDKFCVSEVELTALRKYDAVISPSPAFAEDLGMLDVRVFQCDADQLTTTASLVRHLFFGEKM